MKKLWSYIAVGFAFMSIGIVIGAKWIAGDDYSIEIKKIKQKRNAGDTSVPINIDRLSEEVKRASKEKRVKLTKEERKAKRKLKRANK